ncbi:MAG: hypothetical protein AMXMBFR84_10940 [Candidatus Hydrogenedentota bacterium]
MNPLPPQAIRKAAAGTLDIAIRSVFEPSIAHVGPINTIGCFFLKHLTKCNFVPMAGSIWVPVQGGNVSLQASLDQVEDHQYYVWSECEMPDGNVVLVDFAARYWPAWAAEFGLSWPGKPLPYLWQPRDSIAPETAVYTLHPEITDSVRHGINQAIESYDGDEPVATWEAVINDALERIANRMQSNDEGWDYLMETGVVTPEDEEEQSSPN